MSKYIEMARSAANERATRELEEIEKAQADRKRKDDVIKEVMKLLKEELKQWDSVNGFFYKDEGEHTHVPCASLGRLGDRILTFQCCWDTWVEESRDEFSNSGSADGPAIKVVYCKEYAEYSRAYYSKLKEHTHHSSYDPATLVDDCMKSVAQYLSRFF